MSGIINKVKDALSGDHHDTTTTHGTTHTGPHSSGVANQADRKFSVLIYDMALAIDLTILTARVDSDRDHRGAHGQSTTTGYGHTTTHGPHESNIMNKADPRVDSDRDHRAAGTTGGYGTSRTSGGAPGLTSTGGYGTTHTAGSTNYGPHDSNIANKLDPRVDSDPNRGTHGTHAGAHTGTGAYGSGTAGSTKYGDLGTHGAHGAHGTHGTTGTGSGNYGPHNAPVLNKLDPRVDSDRDHRAAGTTGGYGTSHTAGSTGAYASGTSGEAGYGTHTSGLERDQRAPYGSSTGTTGMAGHGTHGAHGTHGTQTSGTGPAVNTAGPHTSDMMNKLDPRVDSDLDGSKTYGGDKTFSSGPLA